MSLFIIYMYICVMYIYMYIDLFICLFIYKFISRKKAKQGK